MAVLPAELLSKQQKDEYFVLTNLIIATERDNKSGYERKLCDYAPVDKKMYQDKIIEDKVKILSKQFNNQNPECINYDDNFIYSYEQNINKLLSEYQSKIELVSYKNNDIELFKKFMVNTFGSDIKTSEMLQNDLLALENISNKFVVVLQQNNMKGVNDMYGHTKADRIHNLLTAKILMEMKALTNADGYKLCSEYASTSNKILIIFDAKNEKNANDILSQALKSTDKFLETQENIQRNKSFHSINPWQAVYAFSLSFKKGQDTLFDEQFQGFGLEDWEFAYRLSKIHGYSITFDPSIKTTQYDDFKRTQNPFKNLNQNDINLYIKNALYFIEKYPEDKCLHKDLIKFVSKFAYSQKNQKFERIYVDFDELAKKDVNDIIKNYALLTKYKSKLK